MKIVHALGWYFPDSLGGTEVYVAALARRLVAEGHDCIIVAPDAISKSERGYLYDGMDVYRYPIPARASRVEVQERVPTRGADSFLRWLDRIRPDLLHCHTLTTGLGLRELKYAKSIGAALVATCHTPSLGYVCQRGTMMRWGRELCDGIAAETKCAACVLQSRGVPEAGAKLLGGIPASLSKLGGMLPGRLGTALGMVDLIRWNSLQQQELLSTVDAFVVLTEWAREVVARNQGSRSKIVLNRLGIDLMPTATPRKVPNGGPVRFGFVGRFHVTKGVFELAEAWSRLPRRTEGTLELRGPVLGAEDEAVVERLREIFGADPRVRFAEAVAHGDVARVLAGYDVLLCPSTWLEGGPTVALEAQAVGTPVVGSRIGGLAEIIEDGTNGRLLPPGNADALVEIIREIVADPTVITKWREGLPKPRTMDEVAEAYLGLYRDIRSRN